MHEHQFMVKENMTFLCQFMVNENMTKGRNGPKDNLLMNNYSLDKFSLLCLPISVLTIIVHNDDVNIIKC